MRTSLVGVVSLHLLVHNYILLGIVLVITLLITNSTWLPGISLFGVFV